MENLEVKELFYHSQLCDYIVVKANNNHIGTILLVGDFEINVYFN
jgi:ribosomal 30S subunit maturation factor RimM